MKELKGMSIGAFALVTLAVISLFGIAITTQIGDNQKVNTVASDESVALVNGTAVSLAHDEVETSPAPVIYNETNSSHIMDATNYTIAYEAGTVTLDASLSSNTWNITYTYEADTDVTETAELFKAGLVVFATFSGLVALILVGMIILNLMKKPDSY